VSGLEGVGDLLAYGDGFLERQRPTQDFPWHKLQHQEGHTVGLLEAVDGSNVGMIQRSQHAGFALEAGEALGIARKFLGQYLDGDVAAELCVGGAVDLAHAAGADGGQDLVVAEMTSRFHGGAAPFFSSAGQLTITVNGSGLSTVSLTRKRCPSGVTS